MRVGRPVAGAGRCARVNGYRSLNHPGEGKPLHPKRKNPAGGGDHGTDPGVARPQGHVDGRNFVLGLFHHNPVLLRFPREVQHHSRARGHGIGGEEPAPGDQRPQTPPPGSRRGSVFPAELPLGRDHGPCGARPALSSNARKFTSARSPNRSGDLLGGEFYRPGERERMESVDNGTI